MSHPTFQRHHYSCSMHSSLVELLNLCVNITCIWSHSMSNLFSLMRRPIPLSNAWHFSSWAAKHEGKNVGYVFVGLTDGCDVMHSKTSKAVFVATNDVPSIVLFVNITDPRDAIWTVGCVYLCIVVSNATLSYVSIAYQFRIWVKESETSWALIGTRLIRG